MNEWQDSRKVIEKLVEDHQPQAKKSQVKTPEKDKE